MDEGFDFAWRAFKRPYFQKPLGGQKVYMDGKDYVPYLKSWHVNVATPAGSKAVTCLLWNHVPKGLVTLRQSPSHQDVLRSCLTAKTSQETHAVSY